MQFIDAPGGWSPARRVPPSEVTVLDQLSRLLSLRGHAVLSADYRRMLADGPVRRTALRPTPAQYHRFVTLMRDGCAYAGERYGRGALPSALRYGATLALRDDSVKSQFIFYTCARDSIVLSYHRAAARCVLFDQPHTMMVSPHLPDLYVTPADLTFLDAVEECYHRYQIQELGLPPDTYPDGPFLLEDDIGPLWRRAIADRGMRALPIAPAS